MLMYDEYSPDTGLKSLRVPLTYCGPVWASSIAVGLLRAFGLSMVESGVLRPIRDSRYILVPLRAAHLSHFASSYLQRGPAGDSATMMNLCLWMG